MHRCTYVCLCCVRNENENITTLQSFNSQNVLDGLLYSAVGCEGLQLLLNSSQRVGKLLVTDDRNGLFYPVQQV